MTVRLFRPLALAAALLAIAAPAVAQTPAGGDTGGGVVRVAKPVTGQQVYEAVCQACHMADAKGGTGAGTIPALAANPRLAGAAYPISAVVLGKGGMPSLAGTLDDTQIAGVVTYIRTSFGNSYTKPVTPAEVARIPHPARGGGH